MQLDPFLNQKKTCRACGKTKSIQSFGVNKQTPDGFSHRCKLCVNAKLKIKRAEQRVYDDEFAHLRLTGTKLSDYVKAFQLLKSMGYDINKPIHKQFVNKYNLSYKTRPVKSRNQFTKKEILSHIVDTF